MDCAQLRSVIRTYRLILEAAGREENNLAALKLVGQPGAAPSFAGKRDNDANMRLKYASGFICFAYFLHEKGVSHE
jgi:hypothetical protein